ncbi:hypothetical protein WJX72_007840 [[Myrmecia] bisecta]|uniref:Uncharacterized protein n=1 Tax=[Myrmecia] bisecta TaxID=41462 RepID=A0AAW1PLZ7_9CHLO
MFIHEFLRGFIRANMEDNKERRASFRKHVTETKALSDKIKANWVQPTKPYGFWQSGPANVKYTSHLKEPHTFDRGLKPSS